MERKILVMDESDNVGVILEDSENGDTCIYKGDTLEILESIEFAHKVALADIGEKEWIVKYGENIGYATTDIRKGQWIHTHNLACDRGK